MFVKVKQIGICRVVITWKSGLGRGGHIRAQSNKKDCIYKPDYNENNIVQMMVSD